MADTHRRVFLNYKHQLFIYSILLLPTLATTFQNGREKMWTLEKQQKKRKKKRKKEKEPKCVHVYSLKHQ